MTTQTAYTFTFNVRPRPHARAVDVGDRTVPAAELWDRMDDAERWTKKNPELRYVTIQGPGLYGSPVITPDTRARLHETLDTSGTVPVPQRLIGILWAKLDQETYTLYKLYRSSEKLEGYERPYTLVHALEAVDPAKTLAGFQWVKVKRWMEVGVWINDAPAILWTHPAEYTACEAALKDHPQTAPSVGDGLIRAPVRYSFRKGGERSTRYAENLPYIKPTRSQARVIALRRQYPTAWDTLLTPIPVLEADAAAKRQSNVKITTQVPA